MRIEYSVLDSECKECGRKKYSWVGDIYCDGCGILLTEKNEQEITHIEFHIYGEDKSKELHFCSWECAFKKLKIYAEHVDKQLCIHFPSLWTNDDTMNNTMLDLKKFIEFIENCKKENIPG